LLRAKWQAQSIANKLSRGEAEALQLTSADRHAYIRARTALKPFKAELDTVALEYAQARKILGPAPLHEAAREFAKRHPTTMVTRTVKEVFAELIEDRIAELRLNLTVRRRRGGPLCNSPLEREVDEAPNGVSAPC
jgi:hypothetical protein